MSKSHLASEAKGAIVTILVDNYSNALLRGREGVKRADQQEHVLLAEHGFSALIELAGEDKAFLLDAGYTSQGLLHNLQALRIDPLSVHQVIISHGHCDHVGALIPMLRMIARPLPIWVAPGASRERWVIRKDGRKIGPRRVPLEEWVTAGGEIRWAEGPVKLAEGCWLTGPVPRQTDFEKGVPQFQYREKEAFLHDDVPDDQAVVINVQGKGLVIISGCSHAGIVNILHYAQEISGTNRIWAVLGGFHLEGAPDSLIDRTIQELKALKPRLVAAAHCTGFEASCRFAREMPEAFVLNSVGTTYSF